MQAPHLAQPDKRASLQRDWVIWADRCILILVAWWFHGVTACLRPKSPVAHASLDQRFPTSERAGSKKYLAVHFMPIATGNRTCF